MNRRTTFTDDSAAKAIESLQTPSSILSSESYITARVLNRQIKSIIRSIFEDLLRKVLEGLELAYKIKTMESWAVCFSTNLILCVIAEGLQSIIDAMAIYDISEGQDPDLTRINSTQSCRDLEAVPLEYSWNEFFRFREAYNPIQDGFPKDVDPGQNPREAKLVAEIQQMISEHGYFAPSGI